MRLYTLKERIKLVRTGLEIQGLKQWLTGKFICEEFLYNSDTM